MGDRSDPPFKNCSRRQISACNVSTVRASEVQLWRIRSRTRAFQRAIDEVRTLRAASMMGDCLHWQPTTAVIIVQLFWFIYLVNKLSLSLLSLRVAQKANFSLFSWIKVNFNWMKSATKFLWEKTSSSRVVVHSFPVERYIDVGGNTNASTSNVASKWRTPWRSAELEIFRPVVPQL